MKVTLWVIGFLVLIQFLQIDKSNVAVDRSKEISAPKEVMDILKRSCYDCHSFETKYPLYSYVAPISWVVGNNIKNGRKALNFSNWSDMDEGIKKLRIERFPQVLRARTMPKPEYVKFHSEAKLTKGDIDLLIEWVDRDLRK